MPKKLTGMDETQIEFRYRNRDYQIDLVESLVLDDLSVDEIKETMNELPARMAYWKSFLVTVQREIADKEEEFDLWFQGHYMEVSSENEKKTEGWKKSKVMLDNASEYRESKTVLRNLTDVAKKVEVIVSGYNNQVWTLREIARLTHAEISNLSQSSLKTGTGSLADL